MNVINVNGIEISVSAAEYCDYSLEYADKSGFALFVFFDAELNGRRFYGVHATRPAHPARLGKLLSSGAELDTENEDTAALAAAIDGLCDSPEQYLEIEAAIIAASGAEALLDKLQERL